MLLNDKLPFVLITFCSFLLGCSVVSLTSLNRSDLNKIPTVESKQQEISTDVRPTTSNATTSPCIDCEVKNNVTASFEAVWPKMKLMLCPKMRPNQQLGNTLFSLARDELHMVEWDDAESSMKSVLTFGGGGTGFIPASGTPFVYACIYKAANNQINDWLRKFTFDSSWHFIRERFLLERLLDDVRKVNTEPPCIVTAVRDPISHFLSGYNEVEFRYVEDPTRMPDPPALLYTRYQNGSTQRFEQFVADFVGGPKREKWDYLKLQLAHVYSMTGVLAVLDEKNATLTDYLPSLENLTERWPAFVSKACPSLAEHVQRAPDMMVAGQHESSGDPYGFYAAAKAVWKQQGPTARALCAVHALDYACWEKLPDGVPDLCKEVYSSPRFVDQILN